MIMATVTTQATRGEKGTVSVVAVMLVAGEVITMRAWVTTTTTTTTTMARTTAKVRTRAAASLPSINSEATLTPADDAISLNSRASQATLLPTEHDPLLPQRPVPNPPLERRQYIQAHRRRRNVMDLEAQPQHAYHWRGFQEFEGLLGPPCWFVAAALAIFFLILAGLLWLDIQFDPEHRRARRG
jgi:hypothetical protein